MAEPHDAHAAPRAGKPTGTEPSRRGFALAGVVVALLAFPVLQIATGRFNHSLHVMQFAFMYIAMTASWNIIGGYAGYISLGHSAFYGIGGYITGGLLTFCGISPWLSAPLAGAVCCALAIALGVVALRTRGSFLVATLALVILARLAVDNLASLGGAGGMTLPPPELPARTLKLPFYYAMLAIAVAAVYTAYRVRHAKLGLGLRAIAEDEVKAETAGIPTRLYKVAAFA